MGTALLAGAVVSDDLSSRPVRRATVTLSGPPARLVVTDDQGRFAFQGVPAGRFSLQASKAAYVTAYYGAKTVGRGPGVPIVLAEGQQLTTVTLRMARGAVIAGTVMDGEGRPTIARVQLFQWRTVNGERTLGPMPGGSNGMADDRGEYRQYGLAPGEYVVAASILGNLANVRLMLPTEIQWAQQQMQGQARAPGGVGSGQLPGPALAAPPSGQTVGYSTVYYPGTPDPAAASTITLGAGEERTGIDIHLQLVPTATVAGVVTSADGRLPQNMQVNMVASAHDGSFLPLGGINFVRPDPMGRFSVSGITPGQYTITARAAGTPLGAPPVTQAGPPGRPGAVPPPVLNLWASLDLTVDGQDLTGLTLDLQPGMTVSGHVVFEGRTQLPPPDLTRIRVNLAPPPNARGVTIGVPGSTPNKDGAFVFDGVVPGRYRLGAFVMGAQGGTDSWTLKSATVNGSDTLDSAVDVRPGENLSDVVLTFTDRTSAISGTLLDASGRPTADYYILAFSTDRQFWTQPSRRTRQTRPASDGQFTVAGLPPGEYYLAALTDMESADLSDPTFLEQVAAASLKITLAEGEKKTQNVKLAGGT
jgi:hypothetical protein